MLNRIRRHIPADRRVLGLPLGLGLLSVVHLLNDLHTGMLPIVLVYQRQALSLSLAQVGLVAGIYNFSRALMQPLFGHGADRFGPRKFAVGGVISGMLLSGLFGFALSFGTLLFLACLAAIGSAAFHPTGFAAASRQATVKRGLSVSIFLVGGSMGHTLGPLIAGYIFARIGIQGTLWIGVSTLALVLIPVLIMPLSSSSPPDDKLPRTNRRDQHHLATPRTLWVGVIALVLVAGIRTWVHWSLSTYIPQQLVALDFTPAAASHLLSVFLAGISTGILIGGPLSDRFGPRKILTAALGTLALATLSFIQQTILPIPVAVGLAGIMAGLPLSIAIVVGQSLLPGGIGLASGLVVGSSFVAGAVGSALTGVIADRWGLVMAFTSLIVLSGVATIAALFLPNEAPSL